MGSIATGHAGIGYIPATKVEHTKANKCQFWSGESTGKRAGSASQQDGGNGMAKRMD